jgi:hypothetical protein
MLLGCGRSETIARSSLTPDDVQVYRAALDQLAKSVWPLVVASRTVAPEPGFVERLPKAAPSLSPSTIRDFRVQAGSALELRGKLELPARAQFKPDSVSWDDFVTIARFPPWLDGINPPWLDSTSVYGRPWLDTIRLVLGLDSISPPWLDSTRLAQWLDTTMSQLRVYNRAVVSLSRVGLNRSRDQAVLYLRYVCGGTCGYGAFLVLVKSDKAWTLSRMIVSERF